MGTPEAALTFCVIRALKGGSEVPAIKRRLSPYTPILETRRNNTIHNVVPRVTQWRATGLNEASPR